MPSVVQSGSTGRKSASSVSTSTATTSSSTTSTSSSSTSSSTSTFVSSIIASKSSSTTTTAASTKRLGLPRSSSAPAATMAIKRSPSTNASTSVPRSRSPPRGDEDLTRRSQSPESSPGLSPRDHGKIPQPHQLPRRRSSRSPPASSTGSAVRFHVRVPNANGKRLGVVLCRRRGARQLPVVRRIHPDSPIGSVGTVQLGDEIRSFNNQSVSGMSVQQVQTLLDQPPSNSKMISLQFQRPVQGGVDEPPICDKCIISLLLIAALVALAVLGVMQGQIFGALLSTEGIPRQPDHFAQHNHQHAQHHFEQHERLHTGQHQQHPHQQQQQQPSYQDQAKSSRQEQHQQQQAGQSSTTQPAGSSSYRNRVNDRDTANQHERRRQERRAQANTDRGGDNARHHSNHNQDGEVVRPQDMKDLYTLLGVPRGAPDADIKKAYRKLSRTAHPDKGGSQAEFQELQKAYEVLSNGDLRFLYDLHPFEPGRGMDLVRQFLDFEDVKAHQRQMMNSLSGLPGAGFFQQGGGMGGMPQHMLHDRRNPLRGEEDHRQLEVDLADAFTGRKVRVTFDRLVHCRGCQDKVAGYGIDASVDCALCQRDQCPLEKRVVERPHPVIRGMMMTQEVEVASQERCRREHFEIDVEVPRGAPDGYTVVFPRASHHHPGIIPGDLIVHLQLKTHPLFRRVLAPSENDNHQRRSDARSSLGPYSLDLLVDMKLSLTEALLGFNRTLRHLDGSSLLISSSPSGDATGVSSITPHRHRYVVKGKGMPPPPPSGHARQQLPQQARTRDGRRAPRSTPAKEQPGDLVVDFSVVFPQGKLSEDAKRKLRQAFGDS